MVKYNILNLKKKSYFYFDITKIYPCIQDIINISKLNFTLPEINKLKTKLNDMRSLINNKNVNNKIISILPSFKKHFQNMKKFDRKNTIYAKRIKKIIEDERIKSNKAITLAKMQNKYNQIYNPNISITTVSRIPHNHLNLYFRKTKSKNPKLYKDNYIFIHFLFIKTILRAINKEMNLIYIDETWCFLENNYYKDWIENKGSIIKEAENGQKEKYNIIMAINLERIIHFKSVSSNVDSNVFIEFIDELIIKLTNDEIGNSLLILDNVKVHKTKEAIKKYKDNNLKILTNIPYKSQLVYRNRIYFWSF